MTAPDEGLVFRQFQDENSIEGDFDLSEEPTGLEIYAVDEEKQEKERDKVGNI